MPLDCSIIGLLSACGGAAGTLLVKSLIPTSKERFDMKVKCSERSMELKNKRDLRYQEFVVTLETLRSARDSDDAEKVHAAYYAMRKDGDLYFGIQDSIASLILSGEIDHNSALRDHIEDFKTLAFTTIPKYYDKIRSIAARYDFRLTDGLTDNSYRSLRLVLKGHLDQKRYHELLDLWQVNDPLESS